jgi:2-hydroxychromene-2-carboxylate isomerase
MPRPLDFYFDYVSHNAYLAWTQLPDVANRHGLALRPRPVVFGAMLKANGQLGPAEIPPKSRWMLRDVLRKAARLGIPIAPPAGHPFVSLLALRATCSPLADAQRDALVGALFRAVWVESRDVADPAVVADAASRSGLDGPALVADASSDATKARLRRETDAAMEAGVFGVPSMRVGDELFWGFDDLEALEARLEGRDPIAELDLTDWLAVRPAVRRRR